MLKLLLPIFFISISALAQEQFLTIPNDLKTGRRNVKDSFFVENKNDGTFTLFLDDNKTLNGYMFDKNMKPIGSYASNGLPNSYNEIIGYTVSNNEIRLFLKNQYNSKFGSVLFNFDISKSIETELNVSLKKEEFIQSYSKDDKFFILSVERNTSILHLYVFQHNGSFSKKTFDLSNKQFLTTNNAEITLFQLLAVNDGLIGEIEVSKIDESIPNSIEIVSNPLKFYIRENSFILTLDKVRHATYVIEITVPELELKFSELKKPRVAESIGLSLSNSFISNDKIFFIASSNTEMNFTVQSLKNGEILKEINLNKDDSIDFKNSPIIQEGGYFNKERVRELEKTARFLRKISSTKIGISVFSINNSYQITMGGIKEVITEVSSNTAGGFPIGSIGSVNFSILNSTFWAYKNYTNSKSIRIETLFDSDFNHINGEITPNLFDTIKLFAESLEKKDAENVIIYKNGYLYGYYDNKKSTYQLLKFSE